MCKQIRRFNLFLSILLVMLIVLAPASVNASSNYDDYNYKSSDYTLESYDINMVVYENNTFDITEGIKANFRIPKHGIYRKIPLENEVIRLDGTSSKNRVKISEIAVSQSYSLSTENDYKVIKIGDANYRSSGEKDYIISYLYSLGRDPVEEYDELYFNLIGEEWDTTISNISFTITMPKEFDSSKVGFSSGAFGSADSSKISYSIDGNVIRGEYLGTLNSGEALTVRIELPEGYFVVKTPFSYYLMFIIPAIGLLLAFILWAIYGKDAQVVETVEFYPPEGLNSLDVGFMHKGSVENKDITSLLIYLANKGYIEISESENRSKYSDSKGFLITKLKNYDGSDNNERTFLRGLFKGKNGERKTVSKYDLYDSFYKTMDEISSNVNSSENKSIIFEGSAIRRSMPVILLMVASIITIVAVPTLDYADIFDLLFTLGLCAVYSLFIFGGATIKKMSTKLFFFAFIFIHAFVFFSSMPIAYAVKTELRYLIALLFGIICVVGMIMFIKIMPKRNEYGNEMLGKIRGFKNFLETAEKERLEAMVMENPTYFYDILPFAYVLDISDVWIKKFESISMQEPNWYRGRSSFTVTSFGNFVNSTMRSSSTAMSSRPKASSSSSRGGSSGGGSGGGGGGSW